MSQIINITVDYKTEIGEYIKKNYSHIRDFRVLSKSLDARNAPRGRSPKYLYQIEMLDVNEEWKVEAPLTQYKNFKSRPLIIGAGPAGLFAALRFSDQGVPVTLLERGTNIKERMNYVAKFWRYGILDENTNACFGEGGAGLYSDGKLLTRVKSPHISYVMKRLVDFGAPPETAFLNGPHLGSNRLRTIIGTLSDHLKKNGVTIHYQTRVTSFIIENGQVVGVRTSDGREFRSEHIVLAMGHSARDLYDELYKAGVALKSKDFAVGVRIEHPRELINRLQFGDFAKDDHLLGTARYRLSYSDEKSKKGTYSFCMCPGGHVLSTGTESDGLVTNGMSNSSQHSPWSNAALVVTVKGGVDFALDTPLRGADFQREIEKRAYHISKKDASGRELPAQRVTDFLKDRKSKNLVTSSTPSKTFSASMKDFLPPFVVSELKNALYDYDHKIKGFIHEEAQFIAPETRTSAPIQILRDNQTFESISHRGLYPVGEGAGHAGGITSSAVDGIACAVAILERG